MNRFINYYLMYVLCAIGFIAQTQAQVATIPFQKDGLMYIKVKVNEQQEPLNFVFDTGASTVVLDEKTAAEIGVKANYQQPAEGASGTQMYNIALSQKFQVGNITLKDAHTVLVDLERLSKRGGTKIDGIIGANIMKEYITEIDYDEKVLRLYKNVDAIKNKGDYTAVDVTIDYTNIPEIDLEFTLENGQKFSGNFLFDSGANMTFLLNTPFAKENKIESQLSKTIENKSESLTTSSTFKIGKVAGMQFDKFSFGEMPMDISNSTSGVTSSSEYTGIVGVKVISKFNCILDYGNEIIYFKPNKSFADAFEFPRSGISLSKEEGKIKISNVVTAAEAYEKGIREGDQLLEIDDVIVEDIHKCRDILKQKDASVKLKIKNTEGEIRIVTILLKRLI